MANIEKLAFAALDVNGKNYMPWIKEVKNHLAAMGLSETINENNNCSIQENAKANVFLRKHIDDCLKYEYMNIDDPSILWKDLKERFDHQREILLPNARDEWNNLRFQDFKKVNEYSSSLFRICAQLRFCGQTVTDADMLEKTLSTFHASNITLQQQYRIQKFKRYFELNSVLLVAEQNNELLMKNHQSRPTRSVALPEANATNKDDPKSDTYLRGRGRGHGRGRGNFNRKHYNSCNHSYGNNNNHRRGSYRGRRRGRGRGRGRGTYNGPRDNRYQPYKNPKNHEAKAGTSQGPEDPCFRCGMTDHWARTCRTVPHLCKLYQESLKGKEKEANFTDLPDDIVPELNAADFYNDLS